MKYIARKKQISIKVDDPKARVDENDIRLPDNEEEEPKSSGIIINVGNAPEAQDLKKGDRVVFGTFAGDDIEINGETIKSVDEEFIIGWIK